MNQASNPSAAGGQLRARVSVGARSRDQVHPTGVLAQRDLEVRTLLDSTLELVSSVFYPKNCHLEVSLIHPEAPAGVLRGKVRSARMAGPQPLYDISVQLDGARAAGNLRGSWGGAAPNQPRSGALGTLGAGTVPGWASMLVGQGLLTEAELRRIATDARARRIDLEEALTRDNVVAPQAVAACMALDMSAVYVDPFAYELSPSNTTLIKEELARRHGMFPLFHTEGVITLGMQDPTDLALIDQIRLRTNCQVDVCLCPPGAIEALIERAFKQASVEPTAGLGLALSDKVPEIDRRSEPRNTGAAVQLVDDLLSGSARKGASDVHVEPERDHLRVRIRVDGILHEAEQHPAALHAPIISRLKVMAKLDIAETRRPQDGHFTTTVDGKTVDVRVSTIPTVHGENAVLRLLMSDSQTIRLEQLGMPDAVLRKLRHFLEQPNGMVLVTGPTGSGKTSTLYAALERLNTMDRNIVTVEDPVEKRVPLLRQTEVNPKAGITFASGLRSILRQDPDVIMVGEIRDQETAEIAVQAALTGHLVLSTLHTNTAAGALVRLSEMGIPPFLLTSSLRAVIGQRLARRVCTACARRIEPDPRLVAGLGLNDAEGASFMAGRGCERCLQTGFKGRTGIYEILEITAELSRVLLGGATREQPPGRRPSHGQGGRDDPRGSGAHRRAVGTDLARRGGSLGALLRL